MRTVILIDILALILVILTMLSYSIPSIQKKRRQVYLAFTIVAITIAATITIHYFTIVKPQELEEQTEINIYHSPSDIH